MLTTITRSDTHEGMGTYGISLLVAFGATPPANTLFTYQAVAPANAACDPILHFHELDPDVSEWRAKGF